MVWNFLGVFFGGGVCNKGVVYFGLIYASSEPHVVPLP